MADHTLQSTIEIAGSLSPSLQSAINAAVSRLEEMSKETLEAAGASAQLAAKISTQETVLKNLEQGYADYIVTGQEGTEEAEQLASTIQELSGELTENRGTLDAAEKAARALSETMDDAGGEAETLRSTISKQEDTLQQLKQRYVDVATEQGETSDEARELARQIQDLSSELHENKTKLSDAEYAADKLDNSLEEVESSAKKADDGFTMFKATLANLAADAIMRAVDGIKNLVGNVIELGQNFTSTMSEVSAISGATGEDFEKLEACAREYGATTVFSASNAAEALKYMSLAGWDADQSTSALGGVLNLAAASGMELGAASDMVTDYLSAFAMEAGDAAYFADLLSYAQSHSNTTAEALGEATKNCAANLKCSRAGRRNRHLAARRNGKPRLQRIRSRNRHGRDYARHNQRNEGRRDQDRRNLRGRNGRTGQLPRSHRHSHRSGSRHKWNGRRRTSRRAIFHFYRRLHQGPEPDPQRRHGQYRRVRGRTPRSFWIR